MTTAIAAIPHISPEIGDFVADVGATPYLYPILEMTRELLPMTSVSVLLDVDPEVPTDRHVRIEVDLSQISSVDEMLQLSESWTRGLFRVCPSTHAWIFCLGIV